MRKVATCCARLQGYCCKRTNSCPNLVYQFSKPDFLKYYAIQGWIICYLDKTQCHPRLNNRICWWILRHPRLMNTPAIACMRPEYIPICPNAHLRMFVTTYCDAVGTRANICTFSWMFTESSLNVHWMFTECSLNVHWMFTEFSLFDCQILVWTVIWY